MSITEVVVETEESEGVFFTKNSAISSGDLSLVSGTQKTIKIPPINVSPAKHQNAEKDPEYS